MLKRHQTTRFQNSNCLFVLPRKTPDRRRGTRVSGRRGPGGREGVVETGVRRQRLDMNRKGPREQGSSYSRRTLLSPIVNDITHSPSPMVIVGRVPSVWWESHTSSCSLSSDRNIRVVDTAAVTRKTGPGTVSMVRSRRTLRGTEDEICKTTI